MDHTTRLVVNGGAVMALKRAILMSDPSRAVIKSGTVSSTDTYAIAMQSGASGSPKLAVNGGSIGTSPYYSIFIQQESVVYLSGNGGGIVNNGIRLASDATGSCYYTGDNATKFDSTSTATSTAKFVIGTNLFNSEPPGTERWWE